MTDREKKIEEIRKESEKRKVTSSEARDKLYLLEEIDGLREEIAHYWNIMISATSDNEKLRQEIELLTSECVVERITHNEHITELCTAEAEVKRLQQERDKAVAELKRFADRDPYATSNSATRVLNELGVSL